MQDSREHSIGEARAPYLRPRDAAALVLIDRTGGHLRVLMGKRSNRHVFMPNTYVFPGGKRDPGDHTLPYSADLHPDVMARVRAGPPASISSQRARALALAALRELREETGIAQFAPHPDLSCLRFIARAITPPGFARRYDTRFFATFADEADLDLKSARDSDELHDLRWLDINDNSGLNIPDITRKVFLDVRNLLDRQPALHPPDTVPFYRTLHGRAVHSFL